MGRIWIKKIEKIDIGGWSGATILVCNQSVQILGGLAPSAVRGVYKLAPMGNCCY